MCSSDLRFGAVGALATVGRGDEVAVQALGKALRDTNIFVRRAACEALSDMGPEAKAALPTLLELIQGQDAVVRSIVKPEDEHIFSKDELVQDLRPRAAFILGKIGPEARAAVPDLTKAIRDKNVDLRWPAAAALGGIGPAAKSAWPELLPLLEDENLYVRGAVAQALVKIDTRSALPVIQDRLLKRSGYVPNAAVEALGDGGAEALPILAELVRTREGDTRRDAALTLGKIGQPAIPALRELIQDKQEAVRQAAGLGWAKMGTETLPVLKELPPEARFTVAVALEKFKQDGLAMLRELLRDESPAVRRAAAVALGNILAERRAEDERTPFAASRTNPDPSAAADAKAIVELLRDQDADVRWAAVQALGNMKAPKSVGPLSELLKAPEASLRRDAAAALGRMGRAAQTAIPALKAVLQDHDASVARAADEALQKIESARTHDK